MSTTELFITSIACAFTVGVLITAMSYEWSYRRINKRLVGYRVEGITLRTELECWRMGTPYRLETVAAHHATVPAVVSSGVGLRAIGDEQMYSSEWLNDR